MENGLFRKTHRSKYSLNTSYQFSVSKSEELDNLEDNNKTKKEKEWEKMFENWDTFSKNTKEVIFHHHNFFFT